MSKKEKLIAKLLNLERSISFDELEVILSQLGYEEIKSGKTAGSRRAYFNAQREHLIRLHKPHPSNEIKKYLRILIIKELKNINLF